MGKKEPVAEPVSQDAIESEVEDTPVVKELKEIDDKYLAIERKYEEEVNALTKKYTDLQAPFLKERASILADASKAEIESTDETGTPAIPGFWLEALRNHPEVTDTIGEHDEPLMEYLTDVTTELTDDTNPTKGFKLMFHFAENPYITNTVLEKEYILSEPCPYRDDISVDEIKSSSVSWKSGKDLTVAKVTKKVKGGGAKKAKQKETEEPRQSFFRNFFVDLKADEPIPESVVIPDLEDCDAEEFMEYDHEIGVQIKDCIIPFAVRWYTGEAAPDMEDDEDEEEESEMESDEEESDDATEESPVKAKGKSGASKKGGAVKDGAKQEDCKTQ